MEGTPCRDVTETSHGGAGEAALRHAVDFAFSPSTLVTHAVMMCLLYRLMVDGGLGRRQLTVVLVVEELLVYVLWLAVDHGLRAPFVIWICLNVYETIVRPRIHCQDRAVLLTGNRSWGFSCPSVSRIDYE